MSLVIFFAFSLSMPCLSIHPRHQAVGGGLDAAGLKPISRAASSRAEARPASGHCHDTDGADVRRSGKQSEASTLGAVTDLRWF
jgi:hypothetical protein